MEHTEPRSGANNVVLYGLRGNTPRNVELSIPLEKIVDGKTVIFNEAEIFPGKENRLVGTPYSFINGRVILFDSEGKKVDSYRIKIVIEDGIYIPMEVHPKFNDNSY